MLETALFLFHGAVRHPRFAAGGFDFLERNAKRGVRGARVQELTNQEVVLYL